MRFQADRETASRYIVKLRVTGGPPRRSSGAFTLAGDPPDPFPSICSGDASDSTFALGAPQLVAGFVSAGAGSPGLELGAEPEAAPSDKDVYYQYVDDSGTVHFVQNLGDGLPVHIEHLRLQEGAIGPDAMPVHGRKGLGCRFREAVRRNSSLVQLGDSLG